MNTLKRAIPNVITLSAMTCGILSLTLDNPWFILVACTLDKLDGTIARYLKAESAFGAELDSFADFVSFGIAPAFAMTNAHFLVKIIYILATACRLARFNVSESVPYFIGVPSTLSGLIIASSALILHLDSTSSSVILCIFAWLMNSSIKVIKFDSVNTAPRGTFA